MKYFIKNVYFAVAFFALVSFYQDAFAANIATTTPEQNVILGILEENANPMAYPDGIHKNYSREIRVVFQKDGPEWKAFPAQANTQEALAAFISSYPAEVNWTIVFNRKSLGQLTSKTQQSWKYYSNVGFQDIESNSPIPTIGKRSRDYSGYLSEPVYRPLIAVSQSNFKDPEGWKPSALPADLIKLARQQFRQKFPKVENCTSPEENIARPWPYQDSDIKITKTYSSNKGWAIAQLRLGESRCDYTDDDAFYDQWFAISPGKEVVFLDKGMWLVDAGDYDNDGKSELVFAINRENRGGYELFYDNFKKHSIFEFGYH